MKLEIILSIVTLLTLPNLVNADTTEDIYKRNCAVELSNLTTVDINCEGFNIAVNALIKEGYELKAASNGVVFLTK